jgi:Patatin-like phospholipase
MFRILSLDGGGIKGVFTASVLASIEADTKLKIADHFDLIAGTSTGGILAIGLAMGLSAEELLGFYRERGPKIFPATSLIERTAGLLRQGGTRATIISSTSAWSPTWKGRRCGCRRTPPSRSRSKKRSDQGDRRMVKLPVSALGLQDVRWNFRCPTLREIIETAKLIFQR